MLKGEFVLPGSMTLCMANKLPPSSSFLRDLKASLSKTEALERRVPPKMQTYLQKYIDYDTQRMQKGQLASVSLGGPPLLCRHFLPPGSVPTPQSGQSGASTPGGGQPTNGLDENLQKLRIDKSSLHLDKPSCIRRHSDSSLEDEEKRTPLLVKVTEEVDDAAETLQYAIDRSRNIAAEQDAAKDRINEVVDMANSVESFVGGETFQQVCSPRSHAVLLPLTYVRDL